MKKLRSCFRDGLCVLIVTTGMTLTSSAAVTLPFTDSFDNSMNAAWSVATTAQGFLSFSADDKREGSHSLHAYPEAGSHKNGASVLQLSVRPATNPQLAFWYRVTPGDWADVRVDVFDGTWHNRIWDGEATQWTEVIIDLSPYDTDSADFIIRINLNAYSPQHVYLDHVRIRAAGSAPLVPHEPTPANSATQIPVATVLQWLPGMFSDSYVVYGSTNQADVTSLNASKCWVRHATQPLVSPPILAGGATHYWRVVSSNQFGTTTGPVWQFNTLTPTYHSLPHIQTFADGIPSTYHTLANSRAAIRYDANRNSPLEGPANGVVVMEGGGSAVTFMHPGDPALYWDYASEGGYNWNNTARMTIHAESPGSTLQIRFDHRVLFQSGFDRDINMRVDIHTGNGWQQVGGDFIGGFANTNWTRTTQALGTVPEGPFAIRFWSSVKYSEAHQNQGILLDNIVIEEVSVAPAPPFSPIPVSGNPGAPVDQPLVWQNGQNTLSVDLYFSTNSALVADLDASARVVTGVLTNRFTPPENLPFATEYAWRVVAHGTMSSSTTGAVWTFTTQPYHIKPLPYCTSFDINPIADGWKTETMHYSHWVHWEGTNAGGTQPEWVCFRGQDTGVTRAISPVLITTDVDALELSFRHSLRFDTDGYFAPHGPLTMRIQTRAQEEDPWTDEAVVDITDNIAPSQLSFALEENLGDTTQVALTLEGDLRIFFEWYIDDLCLAVREELAPPAPAWAPQPLDGRLTEPVDSVLIWSNGVRSVAVDVYLSSVAAEVETLAPVARVVQNAAVSTYDPEGLEHGVYYYWRVVSKGADEQTEAGPVWSFRTRSAPLKESVYRSTFRADPWDEGWTATHSGTDNEWLMHADMPSYTGAGLPEMLFLADGATGTLIRLISPPIDTRDMSILCVRYQSSMQYWFDVPENLEWVIESRGDGGEWQDEAVWMADDPPIRALCFAVDAETTHIAWTLRGDLDALHYWAIDNVFIHPALVVVGETQAEHVVVRWNPLIGSTGYTVRATQDLASGTWTNLVTQSGTAWTNSYPGDTLFLQIISLLPEDDL